MRELDFSLLMSDPLIGLEFFTVLVVSCYMGIIFLSDGSVYAQSNCDKSSSGEFPFKALKRKKGGRSLDRKFCSVGEVVFPRSKNSFFNCSRR